MPGLKLLGNAPVPNGKPMSKFLNWRLLSILIWLAPALANAAPMSLREAMSYAVQHAPQLDTARRTAELTVINRKNANAAFLPTLDFTGALGKRGSSPSTPGQNSTNSSVGLQLSENLYDNHESLDQLRIAKIREEQGQIQALEARDQFFLDVSQRFYQYSLDRKLLEIQETQFEILKKQYDLVSEGYQAGLRTRKDYLRFRTQISRSEIDLRTARNTIALSKQDLFRLIGVPLGTEPGFDFSIDEAAPTLAPLSEIKVENHRQYRIALLDERAQAAVKKVEMRKNWPQIYLNGGINYGAADFVGSGFAYNQLDSISFNAGLTLRYNILDWGIRRRNVEAAEINEAIAANARTENLLQVRNNIQKLQLDYRQLVDNYRLSEELLELENKNLESMALEYRQGRVQYLDYITSLQNLSDAQTRRYSALFDLKKAQLTYRYNQGTLYEAIFE